MVGVDAFEGIRGLPLFIGAGLLLNITPGVDMALVAARSAACGFRAGAAAALGVGAGCLVHTLAGALGVSALLAQSASAFAVVRWLGAAYLVWMGIAMLRSVPAPTPSAHPQANASTSGVGAQTLAAAFVQGFLTNALNPKVALFFLAFLPQFIDAEAASKGWAFLTLGLVFVVNSTLVNVLFAWVVAHLRQRLTLANSTALWFKRGVGALFVALGLKLALSDGSRPI